MKMFVATLEVLILFFGGAVLVGFFHNWFWAALGLFMCGQAARWAAFHPWLGSARDGLHLAVIPVYKGSILAYIAAGVVAAVGAMRLLEWAVAVIVVLAAVAWVSVWSWALSRVWKT